MALRRFLASILLLCSIAPARAATQSDCKIFLKTYKAEINAIGEAIDAEKSDDVLKFAADLLNKRGVKYRLDASKEEIEILPEKDGSGANRLAYSLFQTRGVKLVYNPARLIFKKVRGSFASRILTIYVPHKFVTDLRPHPTTIHEIVHAVLHAEETAGQLSLFHGSVRSTVFGQAISSSPKYKTYMSFEEIATFSLATRISVTRVKNATTSGALKNAFSLLKTNVLSGKITAKQTSYVAKLALDTIEKVPASLTFKKTAYKRGGLSYTEAAITIGHINVKIPIHDTVQDQKRFLIEKLSSLASLADGLVRNYLEILSVLDAIPEGAEPGEKQIAELIRLAETPRRTAKESDALFVDSFEIGDSP